MAIAWSANGTAAAGTTSVALNCPTTVNAGDLLICGVVNKYPPNSPSTPSGGPANWYLLGQHAAGVGASDLDSGEVYVTVWYAVAAGTEDSAAVTVNITSGNSARGQVWAFSKAADKDWGLAFTYGEDETVGTAWSATAVADPGLVSGDHLFAIWGTNADHSTFSGHAFSATGATFGTVTERHDQVTSVGDDCSMAACEGSVTGGPATTAVTLTSTGSASAGNYPTGPVAFIRMREIDPVGVGSSAGSATVSGVGDSTTAATTTDYGLPLRNVPTLLTKLGRNRILRKF